MITASLDGCVKTWSYEGRLMDTFFGVAERINSMVFIPSIRSAWCSGLNGTITSLDISSGSNNTEYLDRLCGLSTVKMVSLWHFREDSSVFAITADREVVVWRLNLFRPTRCFPSPANKVECLAVVDTRLRGRGMEVVVTGTTEGFLHFWHEDVERAGGVLQVTHDLKPHESAVLCITFVHDIGCFATGGDDGNVVLYTMQDGTEDLLADSPKGGHTSSSAGTVAKLKGHTARVTGLLYLGGRRLASCSHDATIKIWDLDKVSLHHSIDDAHETPISMLCEAAERNEFASVAFELSVRVWCAKTYAPKYKLSGGHTAEIVCCSWRPLRPRSRDTKIVFRQNHRSYLAERKATGQTEAGALNVRGQLKRCVNSLYRDRCDTVVEAAL